MPKAPHLGPPPGTQVHHAKPLPERHREPSILPKATPPAAHGKGRKLPTPEDIIRDHGPKHPMPKGKNPPKKKAPREVLIPAGPLQRLGRPFCRGRPAKKHGHAEPVGVLGVIVDLQKDSWRSAGCMGSANSNAGCSIVLIR